ncbi:MAG TPA: PEP-CTERM sorting domain-containing protein [Tepidisphaeraceae bacterium]|nr:PEP-CTERM sorting domain-containing protein [Tepidisphaeraceae bacterium]
MRKSKSTFVAASLIVIGGVGVISRAAIIPNPQATIYSDSFDGNEAGSLGSGPIGGQNLDVANGIDGGTAGATWNAATTTVTPITTTGSDAVWQYNASNTGANIQGVLGARDTNLISNALLPFTPQPGLIYDLEATYNVPAAGTDNHWIGLAFMQGNGHSASGSSSALSNDNPYGLVIVRDGDASSTTGYVDIFEAAGTGSDNNFNPSATALTGGSVGTTVTVDTILNTQGSSDTMSWYLNGNLVNSTPVTIAAASATEYVAFGDDTAPQGTVSNFSLTVIPEPGMIGLLSLGGVLFMRRRQRA